MKTHFISKAVSCSLLLLVVSAFDYLTGYEVTSFPVFLLPILLATFQFGKVGGYGMCVISTAIWAGIDATNGHTYSHEFYRYWSVGSRFLVYLVFVYILTAYLRTVAVHRRRLEDLRAVMPMCHGCGKILWRDGTWKTPEEVFAAADGQLPECPECEKL